MRHVVGGNYFDGDELKEKGLEQVRINSGEWFNEAIFTFIEKTPPGWKGMGEDIRSIVIRHMGHPHSPNVWGSLTRTLLVKGYIMEIGLMLKPKDPKSHSRKTSVYERV